MELKITITKDVIDRSLMCGTSNDSFGSISTSCGIAVAVRDIFPDASIGSMVWFPFGQAGSDNNVSAINFVEECLNLPLMAVNFINIFDRLKKTPEERYKLVGTSFSLYITDEVIDRINIDEITQLLEDHPILELIKTT